MKELADPKLDDNYDIVDMKRAILTASTCLHHSSDMRPYMSRVIFLLQGTRLIMISFICTILD